MGIYKAYDIRGIYPGEMHEETAERIGHALAAYLKTKMIVVGRDARESSPSMSRALIRGIADAGTNVVDIGQCTTPMVYYAVGTGKYGGGAMVTASHNPGKYTGIKLCRELAIPLSEVAGIREIERAVAAMKETPAPSADRGLVAQSDILEGYAKHVRSFLTVPKRPMKIVVDTANGMVGKFFRQVFEPWPLEVIPLYFEPDGRFPNHEPNPLKDENIRELVAKVRETKADFGAAFDGDGDRCMFVDEKGERIPSDFVTALVARRILAKERGASVVYDLRSSWVVKEEIEAGGGKAVRDRVGHAFMKATVRKLNAPFGGELSGHYYFRDHWFADSGMIAFVHMLNVLMGDSRPASAHSAPLRRYFATGEINFHVRDKDAAIEAVTKKFADGRQDQLDGITIEYADWWCNVRKSNTEPVLRLNLEAKTAARRDEILKTIIGIVGPPETEGGH
ncbi:MAG: phosphomannomutase/phosphoglucomutase [Candidatus Brocadiae bacterium]|nr:phosphomannomutase/phosphoglucomutase [Candidatus Brocadiia bacterium]